MQGWIGVDLDGTLAHYDRWRGHIHIGAPIPKMIARILFWRARGYDVRLFTARAAEADQERFEEFLAVWEVWSMKNLGEVLDVTATKDYEMVEFWDDRAVQVAHNTGEPVGDKHL